MMKILICGLGSIGQRHLRNLRKFNKENLEIAAYRSRNFKIIISEKLEAKFDEKPEDHFNIKSFNSLEESFLWKPDLVFVTNPISLHIKTAILAAKNKANIFIEKPLDASLDGLEELKKLVQKNNLKAMVGYQMRYHPAYQRIKEEIVNKKLGELISADFHFGEFLPGMHPYEDYKDSHASRRDQGGGVIGCLSHEIDLAYWLFGMPKSIFALGGHLSNLQMDVEDTADIILRFENNNKVFPVHVHLDFLQSPLRRFTHIVGDNGTILFNYVTNTLEIKYRDNISPEIINFKEFNRNDMFVYELDDLFSSINESKNSPISIKEGEDVVKICMAAKESISKETIIYF